VIGTQSIDTERYISISQSEACEGFEGCQKGNVTMEELERNTVPESLKLAQIDIKGNAAARNIPYQNGSMVKCSPESCANL